MYDELVKRLREYAKEHCPLDRGSGICGCIDAREAADAIEELQQTVEHYKGCSDDWYKEACDYKAALPRWIPVTERLPEEKLNPNTHDFEYVICATIWGDVRPFKYGTPIGSKDAHFWNGAGYVDAYVTHWMPMPEPPKGE